MGLSKLILFVFILKIIDCARNPNDVIDMLNDTNVAGILTDENPYEKLGYKNCSGCEVSNNTNNIK